MWIISFNLILLKKQQQQPVNATQHPALKGGETGSPGPNLGSSNPADFYPVISQTLSSTNPGPVQWTQTRPTLTGGIPSGRMSGKWR